MEDDSEALKAIWDIYRKGAVIGGTSAGAAIMSDVMITGGDSLGALKESIENKENKHVSENRTEKRVRASVNSKRAGVFPTRHN